MIALPPKLVLSSSMVLRPPCFSRAFLLILIAMPTVPYTSVVAEGFSIAEITRAWEQKEERVQSAAFVWTQRKTITKEHLRDLVSLIGRKPAAKDLTAVSPNHRLYLAGNKISYHTVRLDLDTNNHPDGFRRTRKVFDGTLAKTYLSARGELNHEGKIYAEQNYPDMENINLFPVLVLVRALSAGGLGLELEELQLDDAQYEVNGTMCI